MPIIQIPETFSIECPPTLIPGAKITLCGESPGRQEVAWRICPKCNVGFDRPGKCVTCGSPLTHKPQGFVGGSGRVLERILKHAGITFASCNRTNVVKRRPPGDDFGIFYTDVKRTQPTKELQWWLQLLHAEVTRYRPNIVIAVGGEALRAFCPDAIGITKWQGSLLESPVIPRLKVLPILHTAYIMRDNWEYYYITQTYAKRAAQESVSPKIVLEEPRNVFTIGIEHAKALEWLHHIQTSRAPWYLDIETRGDTIMCFGLYSSARPNQAICVPIQTTTGPAFSPSDEAAIWRALSLAMRENGLLRNQNIVYDLDYLLDYGCEPSGVDFDPMVGMNVLWPEFPKGLDFTTSIFTRYPYYKDEGKTWGKKIPDQQVWVYNCKDMVTTPETSEAIINKLKEAKRYEFCQKRSTAFIPIVMEMMRNRLRLDRVWHTKLADLLAGERIKKHQELQSLIGRDINVKSSPQIQTLLYDELRLPVKTKRGYPGTRTVDEYSLKELRAETNHPVLACILEERHLRTKESNYINVTFDTDPDGELYLGYMGNIGGTKTGRWSYSKSPKWRGSSPQTVSKIMRLMYAPPPGSVFWQRDLSQAEARIVAWLANCRFLLDVFDSPIKIHKLVGSRIFKKPPELIIADSLEYDISKRVVHGYDYKMQSRKIAILANVPYDFAERAYQEYAKEVPEIDEWHKQVKEVALKTGRLVTPMGRVRECFQAAGAVANIGQLPDETWRDLISYVPQSTVPDVLNEGMLKVWQKLPWVRWHQQGHDSYLCSGDPARTEEVYQVAEEAANIHFPIRNFDCFIPGEFQWGYLWGAMLKYIPGESTTRDAWEARCNAEGIFEEAKITEKLYSLF